MARWMNRRSGGRQELLVRAESARSPSHAKVRSPTHLRGTTANLGTVGGSAPAGSQRRWRPPSARCTTSNLSLTFSAAQAKNPPR